jgi:hypothetical protein
MAGDACAESGAALFARLSASRGALGPLAAFAGGALPTTILSTLASALLPLLGTAAALPLRVTCKEAAATVSGFPWEDSETVIKGSIAAWRACFPRARAANVSRFALDFRSVPVVDSDFIHFKGLRVLRMVGCSDVTDAAFVHLRGIHSLDMSWRYRGGVTDAAFAHLAGIHTLSMSNWKRAELTDAAFAHLQGIHTLDISECSEADITDAAFAHLRGIHTLDMSHCTQEGITDDAFVHLRGIHTLRMARCDQAGITDAAFAHL